LTIRDIAAIAGVSPSTVSKIINKKDRDINCETRKRVLQIVKEYNYIPYASVKNKSKAKRFLIGVLVRELSKAGSFLKGIVSKAKEKGYTIVINEYGGDEEGQYKALVLLCNQHPDGLIWEMDFGLNNKKPLKELKRQEITYCCLSDEGLESTLSIPYEDLGYAATLGLVSRMHRKIACVMPEGTVTDRFYKGYKRCLYENKIPYEYDYRMTKDNVTYEDLMAQKQTGAICYGRKSALQIYESAVKEKHFIPEDFSIICLEDEQRAEEFYPRLSVVEIPNYEFGKRVCSHLIKRVEKEETLWEFSISHIKIDDCTIGSQQISEKKGL
jgi:ribokinase